MLRNHNDSLFDLFLKGESGDPDFHLSQGGKYCWIMGHVVWPLSSCCPHKHYISGQSYHTMPHWFVDYWFEASSLTSWPSWFFGNQSMLSNYVSVELLVTDCELGGAWFTLVCSSRSKNSPSGLNSVITEYQLMLGQGSNRILTHIWSVWCEHCEPRVLHWTNSTRLTQMVTLP